MAYTVLARKYRSWTFDELVGQEAVATTLKNAITSGRLHHGYLMCGTRGVGKTSVARILARSLNCLASKKPTVQPCCKCESCVAIAEGQDVDVIEIDAASNTGVDNIRELRGNTLYRPARARFKIYIIDEVHMLSTGAFNALLKTLEEPPEHVKFIMATTEPQKVPATIHSRCQRFDFHSISVDKIAAHFDAILAKEKIRCEPAVTRRVARLANGSMRDGLSLLDQLLSTGSDHLTMQMLDDVLPMPHDEQILQLIGQLADHDPAGALASVDAAVAAGYSLERLTESLAEQFRTLMLVRLCGAETTLVEIPDGARPALKALAERFEPEAFVHAIAMLEELRRTVRFSTLGRALVDAAVARLAADVNYRSIQSILQDLGKQPRPAPAAKAGTAPPPAPPPPPPTQPARAPARAAAKTPPAASPPAPSAPATKRPAAPAKPAPSAASQQDVQNVRANPAVQDAMDLFGGTLINVQRITPAGHPENADEGSENLADDDRET